MVYLSNMAAKEGPYPKVYLYRRIVYAKLFIDKHFADNIDLNHIAGEAAFSKFHFIRLFNSVYKKTPYQYLSYVRVERAKELLKTDIAVAEVCYAVGFESISSFTGLFKRLTGYVPSVYQAEQRTRLKAVAAAPLTFIPNCFAEKNGWQTLAILEK
jgi:AraC-like DNA-binding protein